jgi:alkaline phosphatase D
MILMKRRSFVAGLGTLWLPSMARASAPLAAQPFGLGVASGRPMPGSVVLWTRLLAENPAERLADPFEVQWAIAEDERMSRLVRTGSARAERRCRGAAAQSALLVPLHRAGQGERDRPHAHCARSQ